MRSTRRVSRLFQMLCVDFVLDGLANAAFAHQLALDRVGSCNDAFDRGASDDLITCRDRGPMPRARDTALPGIQPDARAVAAAHRDGAAVCYQRAYTVDRTVV